MDGASYVPLGDDGELELRPLRQRRGDPALATYSRDQRRGPPAALDAVQQIFVEQVPGIVDLVAPRRGAVLHGELRGLADGRRPLRDPQPTGPQAALDPLKLTPTE